MRLHQILGCEEASLAVVNDAKRLHDAAPVLDVCAYCTASLVDETPGGYRAFYKFSSMHEAWIC